MTRPEITGQRIDGSTDKGEPPLLALSIPQFCRAHGISQDFFYKLLRKKDEAPRLMRVGARTLISIEAARDWRVACEKATAANAKAHAAKVKIKNSRKAAAPPPPAAPAPARDKPVRRRAMEAAE